LVIEGVEMKKVTFKDQGVIVTGASSGIGEVLAILLAREGANLVIATRRADQLEKWSTNVEI
jgi:NADP-dependent 3-hydroxy acid dehydrogenase YdfG